MSLTFLKRLSHNLSFIIICVYCRNYLFNIIINIFFFNEISIKIIFTFFNQVSIRVICSFAFLGFLLFPEYFFVIFMNICFRFCLFLFSFFCWLLLRFRLFFTLRFRLWFGLSLSLLLRLKSQIISKEIIIFQLFFKLIFFGCCLTIIGSTEEFLLSFLLLSHFFLRSKRTYLSCVNTICFTLRNFFICLICWIALFTSNANENKSMPILYIIYFFRS